MNRMKESKDNTGNVLKMFEEESKLPVQLPVSLKRQDNAVFR